MVKNSIKSLDKIGVFYQTDKSSLHHGYLDVYEELLGDMELDAFTLLELGFGGYDFPDRGGQSLKMWREYFPNATIVCLEKFQKDRLNLDRIHVFQADQTSERDVSIIVNDWSPLVVIDDASHICPNTIKSFEIIFPLLQKGAIYIVEDTEASYWDDIAVDGTNFFGGNHPKTTMNFFKTKADCLNYKHTIGKVDGIENGEYWNKLIKSITFYSGLIVIIKA